MHAGEFEAKIRSSAQNFQIWNTLISCKRICKLESNLDTSIMHATEFEASSAQSFGIWSILNLLQETTDLQA
jgi:hypothetical protein